MTEFTPSEDPTRKKPLKVDAPVKNDSEPAVTRESLTEKVTTNKIIRRKKPWTRKLREVLIGDNATTVTGYVVQEIIVPAIKDTVADAVSSGIDHMLFGEERGRSSRRRNKPSRRGDGPQVYHNYQRYSMDDRPPFPSDRRRSGRRSQTRKDFDEIIFATRPEAEEILSRLESLIERYETASVSDLYRMVGTTPQYTDDKWGWTDLRTARVQRAHGGFMLDIPDPEPLD